MKYSTGLRVQKNTNFNGNSKLTMKDIVTVDWLKGHLKDEGLILLDASMAATADGKTSEYDSMTIPGARIFDLKGAFSDKLSPFPNTMPGEEQFQKGARELGINEDSKIVVFDNMGVYSSPRVWWMFKTMGHEDVSVLDGGLPEWVKKGNSMESKKEGKYEEGNFTARMNPSNWISYEQVCENVDQNSFTIVDARSKGRFEGTAKEPRKHLKSGHIPHSVNVPFEMVLDDGKFRSESELKDVFKNTNEDNKELVFSCGSGLTACIILLANRIAGGESEKVYDGSWTEWAELQGLFETGGPE